MGMASKSRTMMARKRHSHSGGSFGKYRNRAQSKDGCQLLKVILGSLPGRACHTNRITERVAMADAR